MIAMMDSKIFEVFYGYDVKHDMFSFFLQDTLSDIRGDVACELDSIVINYWPLTSTR